MASLMAISYTVEFCVSAVIIVNYCAQCELLVFYLREISLEIEEKTKSLTIIMKVFHLSFHCANREVKDESKVNFQRSATFVG